MSEDDTEAKEVVVGLIRLFKISIIGAIIVLVCFFGGLILLLNTYTNHKINMMEAKNKIQHE